MNSYIKEQCLNVCKSVLCFALLMGLIVLPWAVGFARILVWVFGD